jgi:CHASE3 domain sensor protein
MPRQMQSSTQRRILVSFLFFLPFTLLVVLTVLLFALSSALKTSTGWVQHTLEVKNAIRNLYSHLLEAESTTRGFLLAHDASFLDDTEIASRAPEDLLRLQRFTKDNPVQQQSVSALEPLIRERLDLLTQLIALQKGNRRDQVLETIDEGKQKMDAIRPILTAMDREEDRLLNLRQARSEAQSRFTRVVAATLLLVDLCTLGIIAFLWRRAKRFEELVTVCAWTKTIQHEGRWLSFEEYLQERFGISVTHGLSRTAYNKLQAGVTQATEAA